MGEVRCKLGVSR